nr:alpha-selinene synthase [Freesia hybrid cultivar]
MESVLLGSPPDGTVTSSVTRRPASANYHPSVWGDYFIKQQFPPSKIQKSEAWIKQRVEELIIKIKIMLTESTDQLQEMQLIDAVQRLGVAYHFEKEIDDKLRRIHNANLDSSDLHFISLRFRLLRQHGYNVPSDVFNKFKDDEGNFRSSLCEQVRVLLSLYEAAYLSIPGEDILDEALEFTKRHLKYYSMESNYLEPALATHISHALQAPLRRKLERLEARQYINIYEKDDEIRNDYILEFAKLDFHLLQLVHREELKSISEWWKSSGLIEKLNYARDRVAECYFWALGVYYEPCYSRARKMLTKVLLQFSLMDDTYDAYGTLEELQLYTKAIQRWNLDGVDELEECMKFQYLALYDMAKDFEDELADDNIQYRVNYLREATKNTTKAWLKEAEWREEGYVPSFEEYFTVSLPSATYPTVACVSYVGMGEIVTKEALDWIFNIPKIVQAATMITRCMDDLVSSEFERKRDHVATAIQCYMKEYEGASSEDTCKVIRKMVEDGWKVVNQECLNQKISIHLLTKIFNLARVMETMYKEIDSYTQSTTTLKDHITLLFVEPISFEDDYF